MTDYADTERQLREWAVIARGQAERTSLEPSPNFSAEARADVKAGFYAQEKLLTEAAAAISDLTKRLEKRDNAITYLLTVCDQFKDGLNWNTADRRVVASTQLTLTDLNMLNSARSVVKRGLSRDLADDKGK